MSQDPGTHKFKQDELTKSAEKKNSDPLSDEQIQKLADLISDDRRPGEEDQDTGSFGPADLDDTGTFRPPKA